MHLPADSVWQREANEAFTLDAQIADAALQVLSAFRADWVRANSKKGSQGPKIVSVLGAIRERRERHKPGAVGRMIDRMTALGVARYTPDDEGEVTE